MTDLEERLEEMGREERGPLSEEQEEKARKTIKCESCERYHPIGTLDAIQTHWYERPRGCIEGDNWHEGELQFVCPRTDVINRLLFTNPDWRKIGKYEWDVQVKFRRDYKHLFRSITEFHKGQDKPLGTYVNNHYVDQKRAKFDIKVKVEKTIVVEE